MRECVRARVGGGVRLCSSSNSHVEFLVMAVSWCVVVRSFQPRPATSTTPRPANPRLVRLGARISPAKTRARQGVPGGVVCPTRRNFCGRCRPCRGPPWLARPATLPTLPALRPAVPPRPPRPAAPTTPRPADLRLGQRACLLGLATSYFWLFLGSLAEILDGGYVGAKGAVTGGGQGRGLHGSDCVCRLSLGARLARDQVDTVVSCPHHK